MKGSFVIVSILTTVTMITGINLFLGGSRIGGLNRVHSRGTSPDGIFQIHALEEGKFEFWWTGQVGTTQKKTLDLGFSKFGGLSHVAEVVDANGYRKGPIRKILFCGQTPTGSGRVAIVAWTGATYSILVQRDYAGRSFVGVEYSLLKNRLYLLDETGKEILYGSFDAKLDLSATTLPTTLSTLVGQTQLPALSAAGVSTLLVAVESSSTTRLIYGPLPVPVEEQHWSIDDGQGPLVVQEQIGEGERPKLVLDRGLLLNQQQTVTVAGRPGTTARVVSALSGQILGSTTIGPAGTANVSLVPPLMLGDIYSCMDGSGHVDGPYATPILQWGVGDTLTSGFQISGLNPMISLLAEVGSTDMSPAVGLDPPASPPQTSMNWAAWLIIGTEQDVMPAGNGRYVLLSNVSLSSTVYWDPANDGTRARGVAKLAVPEDPGLAGSVVCFQWAVQEGSALYLSDIVGYMIRGEVWLPPEEEAGPWPLSGSSSAKQASSSGPPSRKPQSRTTLNSALQARLALWWVQAGAKPLPKKIGQRLRQRRRK